MRFDEDKESLHDEKTYHVKVEECGDLDLEDFYRVEGVKRVTVSGNEFKITTITGVENLDKLVGVILNQGAKVESITSGKGNPGSVFIELIVRK